MIFGHGDAIGQNELPQRHAREHERGLSCVTQRQVIHFGGTQLLQLLMIFHQLLQPNLLHSRARNIQLTEVDEGLSSEAIGQVEEGIEQVVEG